MVHSTRFRGSNPPPYESYAIRAPLNCKFWQVPGTSRDLAKTPSSFPDQKAPRYLGPWNFGNDLAIQVPPSPSPGHLWGDFRPPPQFSDPPPTPPSKLLRDTVAAVHPRQPYDTARTGFRKRDSDRVSALPREPRPKPQWRGPRHTTQEHPFEVVIHYPHHPPAGECVVAFRRVVHGGRVHFAIEQTNGCRVLLPAWMTKSGAAALPMVEFPRLTLASLRELRGLVDAQGVSSLPSPRTTRSGGGDDGTARTSSLRLPGSRSPLSNFSSG